MWKQLGASGVLAVIAALWVACAGETFVDPNLEGDPCDSQEDCGTSNGLQCIHGGCHCPMPGETNCCLHDKDPCDRRCRPANECAGAQDAGATPDGTTKCDKPEDCPNPIAPRCNKATCDQGVCGLAVLTQADIQLGGDCKVVTCDEAGEMHLEATDNDVFNDGNPCTLDMCEQGRNVHLPLAKGTAGESSGRCDGAGHLVECTSDDDCGNPASIRCSSRGSCVPEWCTDGSFDSAFGETAIDCGGSCGPCPGGQACNTNDDCQDHLCMAGKCALATCNDRTLNGAETDTDCGAPSCPACDSGKTCNAHESCKSGVCVNGKCIEHSCYDGVMNGSETGIDCGLECSPCPL